MNIDGKKNIIFVHIPKTGGTTVEKLLFNRNRRSEHKSLSFYKMKVGKLDNYRILSVIRNPYFRFCSVINYFLHGGNGSKHDINIGKFIKNNLDGDSFEWYVDLSERYDFFKPMSYYIREENVGLENLTLLRFESFSGDLSKYCKENGIAFRDIKLRTTPYPVFTITPKQVDFINRFYQSDFKLFGYKQVKIAKTVSYKELKKLVETK